MFTSFLKTGKINAIIRCVSGKELYHDLSLELIESSTCGERARVEWSSSQQKVCFRYKNFGSLRGALPPSHRLLCCRSASIPSHLGSIVQGR